MKIRPTILELFLAKQKDGRKAIYFKPVDLFIKIFLSVWHKARNTLISDLRQRNVEVMGLKTREEILETRIRKSRIMLKWTLMNCDEMMFTGSE